MAFPQRVLGTVVWGEVLRILLKMPSIPHKTTVPKIPHRKEITIKPMHLWGTCASTLLKYSLPAYDNPYTGLSLRNTAKPTQKQCFKNTPMQMGKWFISPGGPFCCFPLQSLPCHLWTWSPAPHASSPGCRHWTGRCYMGSGCWSLVPG